MYHSHVTWIESIRPILQLFVSSFHLKYIFLFNHRNPTDECPLEPLVNLIQPAWNIFTNSVLSSFSISSIKAFPLKITTNLFLFVFSLLPSECYYLMNLSNHLLVVCIIFFFKSAFIFAPNILIVSCRERS